MPPIEPDDTDITLRELADHLTEALLAADCGVADVIWLTDDEAQILLEDPSDGTALPAYLTLRLTEGYPARFPNPFRV